MLPRAFVHITGRSGPGWMRPVAFLMLIALASLAHARPWRETATLWFRADIEVGPAGRVTDLAWRNYKPMPEPALRALERVVPTWQFRPTSQEAEGAMIGTTLYIEVRAREQRDGRWTLEVQQALTGPSVLDATDERGWQRWERVHLGRRPESVEIVYDVDVAMGSAPRVELLEYGSSHRRREDLRETQDARARGWIAGWQVRHETIDGRPVVARFRYLFAHCVIPLWCKQNKPDSMAGMPDAPEDEPIPRASLLALATPVRGTTL